MKSETSVNKSARITNKLLDDILMWARTQQGKIPFKPQILSFKDICKDTLEILTPNANVKHITIKSSSADHINLFADIDMLKTVLRNLVSNAIKFTKNGGAININAKENSGNITISVSDNGIGISPDNLAKLFDISEVMTTKGTAKETGTGLGLLLCKEFVEKHGGKIWVESEEGIGSTFYFTIPYHAVLQDKETLEPLVLENKDDFKSLKILIVEDDEISYSILSKRVQKISNNVLHAITGVEAVESCRTHTDIDLVLMDIKMPQMDGLEATRLIREFNKDVIIIAQTAYAFPDDNIKAIKAGCNDFIAKPINKTQLFGLIKKHCNK